jgi:lincosamide and streptogramin A transport system ATP-binding/permease protein
MNIASCLPHRILTVSDLSVSCGGEPIFSGLSFSLEKGSRLAVTGPNGSGKTTLLRAVLKEIPFSGTIRLPRHITLSRVSQFPRWHKGFLRPLLEASGPDETVFRNVLGILGVSGEIFSRPLETFSLGELKKAELARSLSEEAGLFVWDEPLNYLDLVSREQLEEAIIAYQPTLIFIEHDKTFIDRCATCMLPLK